MRRATTIGLMLALAAALPLPAVAGELSGIEMPDTVEAGEHELHLNGMALRKAMGFVKVYVAGLYLPKKMSDGKGILQSDAPRRVMMQFVRDVERQSMCDAWYEGLEANVPNPSDEIRQQFDQLCEWMPDVKEGDRFVFTYTPEHGTHVGVAGHGKGTLEGKPFADALFSSWIGPHPGPGEKFKQALLGN